MRYAGSSDAPDGRLVGGNRPFPRTGSVSADMPYITCLRAAKYFDGLCLHVPKRAIPVHEADDILEVKVVRCARPDAEVSLYTRHLPGSKRAILDLRQLSASYGEELWVTGIRPYTMEMFAADYNRAKPRGLENTELRWNDGLSVRIEDGEFALEGPEMSHFKGMVNLKAGLGDAGPAKITKGVEGFSLRLYDHPLVQSMRTDGECVLAAYKFPSEAARRRVMNPVQLRPRAPELAFRFKDCVEVASRPDSLEAEYVVSFSPNLITHVARRLAGRSLRSYTKEKGDIGEELIDAILSLVGYPQITSHPLYPGRDFDSSRKGPDSLRSDDRTIVYFEFKWWSDVVAALDAAKHQLMKYRLKELVSDYDVKGAYTAVLEWYPEDSNARVLVTRVW